MREFSRVTEPENGVIEECLSNINPSVTAFSTTHDQDKKKSQTQSRIPCSVLSLIGRVLNHIANQKQSPFLLESETTQISNRVRIAKVSRNSRKSSSHWGALANLGKECRHAELGTILCGDLEKAVGTGTFSMNLTFRLQELVIHKVL